MNPRLDPIQRYLLVGHAVTKMMFGGLPKFLNVSKINPVVELIVTQGMKF